jgi:hypothetical protein
MDSLSDGPGGASSSSLKEYTIFQQSVYITNGDERAYLKAVEFLSSNPSTPTRKLTVWDFDKDTGVLKDWTGDYSTNYLTKLFYNNLRLFKNKHRL